MLPYNPDVSELNQLTVREAESGIMLHRAVCPTRRNANHCPLYLILSMPYAYRMPILGKHSNAKIHRDPQEAGPASWIVAISLA